jgi:hypothetical protein
VQTRVVVGQSPEHAQAVRDAARTLEQAVREVARAQREVSRIQSEVKSAEQTLARAQSDGAREVARERLDDAREQLQAAQENVREAQDHVREAQENVRDLAREQADQAREIAAQVREQVREQIQVPAPPLPPEVHTIQIPTGRGGPWGPQPQIPEEAVIISVAFFVTTAFIAVGWPIARALGRRLDRKTIAAAGAPAQLSADVNARLERIEHSVEAISIEVERISEGQRYATKLLSEMRPTKALPPGPQVPELIDRE